MPDILFLGDVVVVDRVGGIGGLREPYVFNLEAPITDRGDPYPGKVNLRSSKAAFDESFVPLPVSVCLANNHIFDYGVKGFVDTVEYLRSKGVSYFGAGKKEENYNNPAIVDLGQSRIALLGYVCPTTSPVMSPGGQYGCATMEIGRIRRDITKSRTMGADRVVVQMHWGAEEVVLPKEEDVRLGRSLIDIGADLVVGHHSHVVQSSELYNGKYIFYGLGNFIMPDLDVVSFFGSDHEGGRRYSKKQYRRNRESVGVIFDVVDCGVHVVDFLFDGSDVCEIGNSNPPRKSLVLGGVYNLFYKYFYVWGKMVNLLYRFMDDPKVPRINHIKNVAGVIMSDKLK